MTGRSLLIQACSVPGGCDGDMFPTPTPSPLPFSLLQIFFQNFYEAPMKFFDEIILIQVRSRARWVHFSFPPQFWKVLHSPPAPSVELESHQMVFLTPRQHLCHLLHSSSQTPAWSIHPSIHPSIHLFIHSMNVMKCQLIGPELSSKVNKATLSHVPGFSCHQRTPQASPPNETFHSLTTGSPVTMGNLYLSNASYVPSTGLVRPRLLPWRVLRKQPR